MMLNTDGMRGKRKIDAKNGRLAVRDRDCSVRPFWVLVFEDFIS